nr:BRO family protein [Candidatus Hamiltonella defensa]
MTTSQTISFSFQETHDVRIKIINSEPWFCLRNICEVLNIENHRDLMAKQLDKKG